MNKSSTDSKKWNLKKNFKNIRAPVKNANCKEINRISKKTLNSL